MAHKDGGYGEKPPNQGHTSARKPKAKKSMAKGTMGLGKTTKNCDGAMGKHQRTVTD